jgi:hypothetical protein
MSGRKKLKWWRLKKLKNSIFLPGVDTQKIVIGNKSELSKINFLVSGIYVIFCSNTSKHNPKRLCLYVGASFNTRERVEFFFTRGGGKHNKMLNAFIIGVLELNKEKPVLQVNAEIYTGNRDSLRDSELHAIEIFKPIFNSGYDRKYPEHLVKHIPSKQTHEEYLTKRLGLHRKQGQTNSLVN